MRDATIDSYSYALAKFVKSVGSSYLVSDINQDNLDMFVEDLSVGEKPHYDLLFCDKTKRIEEI